MWNLSWNWNPNRIQMGMDSKTKRNKEEVQGRRPGLLERSRDMSKEKKKRDDVPYRRF